MKITMNETTIEANTDELRASNSLSDGLTNVLRGVFSRILTPMCEMTSEEEEEDGSEE